MAFRFGERRIPVVDSEGDVVGWVISALVSDYTEIAPNVSVPTEFVLRFPGDVEQPALSISYSVSDGAPIVSAVSIEAKPGGRRVQRSDVETVAEHLGEFTDMATKAVMQHSEELDGGLTIGDKPLTATNKTRAGRIARKRSNQKVNDAMLREVAALYRENENTGGIYEAIRNRFGKSEPTAARYVQLARDRGFLPPATKGKKK